LVCRPGFDQSAGGFTEFQAQDTIVEIRIPSVRKHAIPQGTRTLGTKNAIPLRRTVMSLRKLCCFTMLATIVAFPAAGRLNRYTRTLDVAKPGTPLPGQALAAEQVPAYSGQPANHPGRSHWAHAVRTKSEVTPAVFAPLQSNDARDLGAGKLLVASRDLHDPNFAKTVILLLHYDDQGVVGLILNRRTDVALSRVLEDYQGAKDRSDQAYLGGPVEVPAVFALLQSPAKVEGAERIFTGVYLISTKTLFEKTLAARPDPQVFHVYLGYAGWTKDQLRGEVQLGAWFVFPADTGAVFNSDPGSLWPQMIRKTELKVARNERPRAAPRNRAGPFVEMGTNSSQQQVARR
jgi:putative transcriptional regulator